MHFIISLNRFCAAAFPIQYRHNHTNVLAVSLSVGAWIAAHTITLPGIIIDAEKYRKLDLSDGCQVDVAVNAGQKNWMICVQFSTCTVIGSILLMYAFIIYKQAKRQRKIFTKGTSSSVPTEYTSGMVASKKLKANATTLLTVITCSLVVFWSPATIYYAIVPFQDGLWNEDVVAVLNILFNFQTVMDPVIMALAVSEIREYVLRGMYRLQGLAKKESRASDR
ncbi:uncharacterized protein LOC129599318 [Paramacrobiotus metropolitanus]|uniref:uncharacterized protein LOC129599318 n=1 Tax=Paramacrobiotus metropolitanus TaxID=2943436 RepID=UPI002445C94A|nr:uncharacterized protein LOC129599318 [Paramacrobiotus metropolitanus]